MAFWNRNKVTVTPEFEEYYMAERHERNGLAWLLALVSFAVSLAIILLLFVGGKWAYRRMTHADKKGVVATSDAGSSTDKSTPDPSPAAPTPSPTPQPAPAPAPAPTPSPTPIANPTPTPNPGSVPKTGAGSVVGLFILATTFGTLLYRVRTLKKISQ
jgi:hypothetical protein